MNFLLPAGNSVEGRSLLPPADELPTLDCCIAAGDGDSGLSRPLPAAEAGQPPTGDLLKILDFNERMDGELVLLRLLELLLLLLLLLLPTEPSCGCC